MGEECVINRAKNFNGKFLETTFCLSDSACLLFLASEKMPALKEFVIEREHVKDHALLENTMKRNFILKKSLRQFEN